MLRGLIGLTAGAAFVLSAHSAFSQEVPPCRPRSVNVEHANYAPKSNAAVGFLCAQGSLAWIHLEVRQATITTVLSAMRASYNVSYRSSIALNDTRDGVYSGSLREVMEYLLSDYDYVIKLQNSTLDVEIFGKSGTQAISAPVALEVKEKPARRAARVSRTR